MNINESMKRRTCAILSSALVTWLATAQAADEPTTQDAQRSSQAPTSATAPSETQGKGDFVFEGGSLRRFIDQMNAHFEVDLRKLATIEVPENTHVPKMRVSSRLDNRFRRIGRHTHSIEFVLQAYNALAEGGRPELGKWFVWNEGQTKGELPGIITLAARRQENGANALKVRAFSIKGFSEEQRKKIERAVREAQDISSILRQEMGVPSTESPRGHLNYHADTDLLLAFGSEAFLEMTESIVEEYRESINRNRNF